MKLLCPTLDIAPIADKDFEEEGEFGEQVHEDDASFHVYEEA